MQKVFWKMVFQQGYLMIDDGWSPYYGKWQFSGR